MFLASILVASQLAPAFPRGSYVCTVEQKAGIGAEQQEGAEPPSAFIAHAKTRFRILVLKAVHGKMRVEETAYAGPERDPQKWQTKRSVLHGAYFGDGWRFSGPDQAVLRLDMASEESGWLFFHHAGFEKPDADHLNLSVRWGACAPEK